MITSLTLENWKSYSSSSFKFCRGTNVLVGRMGSGKSSVLDALCFALYGTFPKMSRRDQTTEHLVNITSLATGEAQHARVMLQFEKGGAKYEVERKIGKKTSDAEVRCEGKLVQKGAKAVTDYITNALGVDYELFTRAIYSEQNRIDYLLSLNPRARKGEIDWLLGLGQFDEAREAAQAVAGKLSEQSQALAADAQPEKIEETEAKCAGLELEIQGRNAKLSQMKADVLRLSSMLSAKQTSFSSLEKVRAEWKARQSELERLQGAHERLKSECADRKKPEEKEIAAASLQLKELEDELSSEKAKAKALSSELSAVKSAIAVAESGKKLAEGRRKRKEEAEARLKALLKGKTPEELEKELGEVKAQVEQLTEQHSWLHAQKQQLQQAIDTLGTGVAKCPVCDADLAAGKAMKIAGEKKTQVEEGIKLAGKLAEELAGKKLALAEIEGMIGDSKVIAKEMEGLSAEGTETAKYGAELAEQLAKKAASEKEADELDKRLVSLQKEIDAARKFADELSRAAKLFADFEEAHSKLDACGKRLAELKFDESEYEGARKDAEGLRVEHAKADSEATSEERQLKLLESMLSQQKVVLGGLEKKAELAKKYSDAASSMQIYKNSLSAAQTELRATLVEEINAALAEIWPSVYPYSDYGGVSISADEKDYRLLMEKDGWREVDAVASGGERACLCLALRIAFATVLTPDIGWLILDEPTHNLDADAVSLLSEAISRKIPSIVEQTFVITHEPSLAENVEGAVFRLERDKGKNEATKVEAS